VFQSDVYDCRRFRFHRPNGVEGAFCFGWCCCQVLRRTESTPNLTSQLYNSGIYTWECLRLFTVFRADPVLTTVERERLRRYSVKPKIPGHLYQRAGRKIDADSHTRGCLCRSLSRLHRSLPDVISSGWPSMRTIRKGTQFNLESSAIAPVRTEFSEAVDERVRKKIAFVSTLTAASWGGSELTMEPGGTSSRAEGHSIVASCLRLARASASGRRLNPTGGSDTRAADADEG